MISSLHVQGRFVLKDVIFFLSYVLSVVEKGVMLITSNDLSFTILYADVDKVYLRTLLCGP